MGRLSLPVVPELIGNLELAVQYDRPGEVRTFQVAAWKILFT